MELARENTSITARLKELATGAASGEVLLLRCGTARLNVNDRTTFDKRAATCSSGDALATLSSRLVCAAIAPTEPASTTEKISYRSVCCVLMNHTN
eukprot:15080-Heterococcus_DN1.PRE.2